MECQKQVLVLTPDGVVLDKGRKPRTLAFAAIRKLGAAGNYGVVNLTYFGPNGKRARLQLDGRFGDTSAIARAILQAYQQVHAPERR